MGKPQDHLPSLFEGDEIPQLLSTIASPSPVAIRPLKATAAFHIIYVLTYSAEQLSPWLREKGIDRSTYTELILRVSGDHIAKIKTENEVAVLSWVRLNSTIPVPFVAAYDSTLNNSLGREYILMTREPGECLADVYQSMTSTQMDIILDQLIEVQVKLHAKTRNHIGGLRFSGSDIVPGPVLEETFWLIPDIHQYWPTTESFSTLNISGPFRTYVEYITALLRSYMHAIETHPSLKFMRETIPRLEQFIDVLNDHAEELNRVALRLAHKDLHYANFLVDRESNRITAILDWEFAGVVPYPRWNPSRAFLWNAQDTGDSPRQKADMFMTYEQRAIQRGFGMLVEDAKFGSLEQENMQLAVNFLRAIVEVSPRGERGDTACEWKQSMLSAIANFGA